MSSRMKNLSLFSFIVLGSLSLTTMGCDDGGGNSLERLYGATGATSCELTGDVFKQALSVHVSKTEADRDRLYTESISNLLEEIHKGIITMGFKDPGTIDKEYQRVRYALFGDSTEVSADRLKDCGDLNTLYDYANKNSVPLVPRSALSLKGSSAGEAQSLSIFQRFLHYFGKSLDPFSDFIYGSSESKPDSYGFGIRLDLRKQRIYDQKTNSVEVFATDSDDNALKPGDRIFEITLPSETPLDPKAKTLSVMEIFNTQFGMMFLNNVFSSSELFYMAVKVLRKGAPESSEKELVSLARRESNRAPLVSVEIFNDQIIYIRLYEFEAGAAPELARKLRIANDIIKKKNLPPALIFDLRFNPGGYVVELNDILNKFIPSGDVLKLRRRKRDTYTEETISLKEHPNKAETFLDNPMIVVANHESASAADINTRTLKDTGRAFVVGETSFGKFIGQGGFPLPALNGGFRITDVQIYDAKGKNLQAIGEAPNLSIVESSTEALKRSCESRAPESKCFPASMAKMKNVPGPGPDIAPLPPLTNVFKTVVTTEDIQGAQAKINALPNPPNDLALETSKEILMNVLSHTKAKTTI